MFHKKTLGATIAVALSLGIAADSMAASFAKYPTDDMFVGASLPTGGLTSDHIILSALSYAYEQFGKNDPAGNNWRLDYPFRVRYALDDDVSNVDVYVTFTLSNGATWQTALRTESNIKLQSADGMTSYTSVGPKVSLANGGQATDSSVTFLVNSAKVNWTKDMVLDFSFKIKNVNTALGNPGGQIKISVGVIIVDGANFTTGKVVSTAAAADTPLASSAEGMAVTFVGPQDGNPAYISVVNDGKTFEGPGRFDNKDTQVSYGTIELDDANTLLSASTTCIDKNNTTNISRTGATSLNCSHTSWQGQSHMSEGTLSIEDGNFNASGKASDGHVYIKTGTDPKKYVYADEFTNSTTAKWKLVSADDDFINIYDANGAARDIILEVNGTDAVIENRQIQPKGTLVIKYDSGNTVTRTAFLRHLKKNGTVCTLYNIPPSDAIDVINIRITNDSSSVDGFVKGKLRDDKGGNLYQSPKTLVELGNLKPHQTVRLTLDDLKSGGETWKGRAVLVLESNIPHPLMQVFGLMRAKEGTGFPETPLMNMSTGATGNSCD